MQIWNIMIITGWIGLFIGLYLFIVGCNAVRKKKQSVPRLDKTALVLTMVCFVAILLLVEFLPKMVSIQESISIMHFMDLRTGMVKAINLKNIPISERHHYKPYYKLTLIEVKHPSLITE